MTEQSLFTAPLNDVMDLLDYLQHLDWRCGYLGRCHCGLDALTDKLGLERVKMEEKFIKNKIERR